MTIDEEIAKEKTMKEIMSLRGNNFKEVKRCLFCKSSYFTKKGYELICNKFKTGTDENYVCDKWTDIE
jgi:hypothetical protein